MSFRGWLSTAGASILVASVASVVARQSNVATARPTPQRRLTAVADAAKGPACPWTDSTQTPTARVNELLAAMTPTQEATLLHLLNIKADGLSFQGFTPAMPALCIPTITEQDGAAGVSMKFKDVTQLPAPIADAAAFDPALAGHYGDVIGTEDAAKGIDVALAPTINIDRSPRWGRSYESLGEDPFLTASLAVPLVKGIQAQRVVAVVKHLVAYNQETARGTSADDSIVSDQALREIYLPAWSATVQQADPGGIMCSYNLVNGTPACQSQPLLDTILRNQWHYQGFVRSDCGSIYSQAAAIAAGVSQVKCSHTYHPATLAQAVASGATSRATLDDLARPLLMVLFSYNLIASPHPLAPLATATTPGHQAVGLATDNEGAVLLKNTGGLLPLDFARLRSLALIGPHDGTPMAAGFGAVHVRPTDPVSALSALEQQLGHRVHYSSGADISQAAVIARQSEVAVVVVNDVEAEGRDRANLGLPGTQDTLIEAVEAANPRTVVVLETGSAVTMPWLSKTPALLETWYPGQAAGTSLAQLLSGEVDPSGKLPVTFPTTEAAMPDNTPATFGGVNGRTVYRDGIDVGYRWYDVHHVTPAFPFGYGLSYTHFTLSDLQATGSASAGINAAVTLRNAGNQAGADVVQCYLGAPTTTGEPPRQLRAFQRVSLDAGQSRRVQLSLTPGDLAHWSTARQEWIISAGSYRISIEDGSTVAHRGVALSLPIGAAQLGADSGPAPVAALTG